MIQLDYYSYAPSGVSLETASELTSLVLVLASFAVVLYLNTKVRKVRSFQFEMLLFTVILVAAEVPRTLYTLRVVNLDWIATAGLALHSVSMVVLTLFVAYRVSGFYRGAHPLGLKGTYEDVVLGAVEKVMISVFGTDVSRAVDFYVDKSIAISQPASYERALERMFGEGSKILRNAIIDAVSQASGIERGSVGNFEQCWSAARAKLGNA